jgi:carbon-monoxide dehydrogenase small subunit
MKLRIQLTVNKTAHDLEIEPRKTLLAVLRDQLGLTGTKEGCSTGDCGACTVLIDAKPVTSCLVLAASADGCEITTIEGLAKDGRLHPVQQAFIDVGGMQCGFCTPGIIMSAYSLLQNNPSPSDAEIRSALAGNLCRCTGYTKVVEAVRKAASQMRRRRPRKRSKGSRAA